MQPPLSNGTSELDPTDALDAAKKVAESFTREWQKDRLSPDVTVDLEVGASDQPIFIFSLLLELSDDIDPHDYPSKEIETLQASLRDHIANSPVDRWKSVVVAGAKHGVSGR